MESDRPERDAALPPAEVARLDWRALRRLRERVELAAREIERLRDENAALARRVAELQEDGGDALLLDGGETREALRARVETFVATLDRVLADDEARGDGASPEAS